MVQRKKWFVAVLILVILALVVGGAAHLFLGSIFSAGNQEPSGTWSVEESFPNSPVSDFRVKVQGLKKATHFELYVDGVHIGERVTLAGYIRSVPLVFSKPAFMEVWFFEGEDAAEPFARAGCHQSGALVFHKSDVAYQNDHNPPGEKENNNGPDSPSIDDQEANPGLVDEGAADSKQNPIPQSNPGKEFDDDEPPVTIPGEGNQSGDDDEPISDEDHQPGDDEEEDAPGPDMPAVPATGSWFVEPGTPPTALFKISVLNIDPEVHYELYASGNLVGKRVPISEGIRSIKLMFSKPSELRLKFYSNKHTTSLLTEATCSDEGDLVFID